MKDRQRLLDRLSRQPPVDVLIIGAGISGVAVFRDLALQKVNVIMVDQGDFSSGTSATSSHNVHGGLRYLENGEFRLVREAVRQRNLLLQSAPHLIRPLPTTIPIYKRFSGLLNAPLRSLGLRLKPRERGAAAIKLGLGIYDRYTRDSVPGAVPAHRFASRQASLERFPHLNPNILCTVTYYDASMVMPERVAVELIADAEADWAGAWAINYLRADSGAGEHVVLRDELSGGRYRVAPKVVVNAAGPWIDRVNGALGQPTHFVGGTKGSHLVLDHPQLRQEIGDHQIMFENDDGRIVLLCPLANRILIGSTDIPWDDPDRAFCTADEDQYFLTLVQKAFPGIAIGREHIVFRTSGVRPLPAMRAATTGQISRDHSIQTIAAGPGLQFPIHCMVGGKWTPFRAFGQEVTDLVLTQLGRQRQGLLETLPIGGGRNYPATQAAQQAWLKSLQADAGLPMERLQALFGRYGTGARQVAAHIAAGPDEPLHYHAQYSRREIAFLAQRERVLHLDDLLLRRTSIAFLGELTPPLLEELAGVAGETLGWSLPHRQAEMDRAARLLEERHGILLRKTAVQLAADALPE